jgi:hypothetical protein
VEQQVDWTSSNKGAAVASVTAIEVTPAERERRVAEAIHSGEMEGLRVDPGTQADADEYVAGRIDSDELVARARARYGLA